MDFMNRPECNAHGNLYNQVLLVVERATRFLVAIPCHSTWSSTRLIWTRHREIYCPFGFPDVIVSDRDPRFTSAIFVEHLKSRGITTNFSTAWRPQTDGLSEANVKKVSEALRLLSADKSVSKIQPEMPEWYDFLPQAIAAINTTVNTTTGYEPMTLLMGYVPTLIAIPQRGPQDQSYDAFERRLTTLLEDASMNTDKMNMKSMTRYNRGRPNPILKINDWVLLSTKHLSLGRTEGTPKSRPRWTGPFQIIGRVGAD